MLGHARNAASGAPRERQNILFFPATRGTGSQSHRSAHELHEATARERTWFGQLTTSELMLEMLAELWLVGQVGQTPPVFFLLLFQR